MGKVMLVVQICVLTVLCIIHMPEEKSKEKFMKIAMHWSFENI